MLRRSLLLVLLLVGACAAHEKTGDRAAALGDWRSAERSYAEALRKDPEKKELQEKYRQAKTAALADATRRADACAVARDWECALAESSYALGLDPGSAAMATLRREAGREAGFLRLRRAADAAAQRDVAGALNLVLSAREASDDAAVVAEARRVSPRIVRDALAEADAHRAALRFQPAIDLLSLAARVDPAVAPRVEVVRAELERWKDGEAERLAAEGDALLASRRYGEARTSYESASKLRPQHRAAPLARYAALLATGAAAVERRDFPAAERAFGEAAHGGLDRGLALEELDRVKIRPYAIRLRSVLVQPTRPDGYPWAGRRSGALDRVVARLTSYSSGTPVGLALDLARRVPRDNQPTLVVTVGLPDGRGLQTSPRRGVYAVLDGSFVVATNAYDERVISLRVVHDDGAGRPLDVGVVSFQVAELVGRGELSVADGSVSELRVEADPADLPDGAFAGLSPIPDADNLAAAWSVPTAASRAYRVTAVDAQAVLGDFQNEGAEEGPSPDLFVELRQRGTIVYRSPVVADRNLCAWRPQSLYLFVEPQEPLLVRVVDHDPSGDDVVLSMPVPAGALERGAVELATPRGSVLRLRVEPRRVMGPAQVASR